MKNNRRSRSLLPLGEAAPLAAASPSEPTLEDAYLLAIVSRDDDALTKFIADAEPALIFAAQG